MAVQNSAPGQDPRELRHAAPQDDDRASVIRHEERLVIHREQQETGRARLRKYVVTEPVRQEVTLGTEEPDLVRTPITAEERQAFLDGHELALAEDEVILYRSEPVVQTVRVPYQRVRLVAKRVEHTEVVEDTLRKERVDIETEDERPRA
ncbi:YsnF/AvaK domain-containing protein [Kocuria sp.]|uniref:YsnF/AvaK domain-containing protein n=1 Tax=Kocuria sp. TaxID=1871328 RepID=UPI0026DD386E|nr:YsnF/AvaK domain-containing protein [Kocuria sp.]MDO4919858.1 YsnF/AvaK domain-containing protein [Kocuria sp.]